MDPQSAPRNQQQQLISEVPAKRSAARSRAKCSGNTREGGEGTEPTERLCVIQREHARRRRPRVAYAAKLPSRRAPKPTERPNGNLRISETQRGEEPREVQREYARRRRPRVAYAAKLPSRRAPKPTERSNGNLRISETQRGEEPREVQREYARRRRGHRSRRSAYIKTALPARP
jgi:hypothetical protein